VKIERCACSKSGATDECPEGYICYTRGTCGDILH
jgi:hypothetical protein